MLYVYWFCAVFVSLIVVVIIAAFIFSPKHEDLENVLNAVEKTFPDSSTYNVSVFCEENYGYALSFTFIALITLEEQKIVRSFTKDGVYYATNHILNFFDREKLRFSKNLDAGKESIKVSENDNKIPVLFWQITGRLNKNKKKKSSAQIDLAGKVVV